MTQSRLRKVNYYYWQYNIYCNKYTESKVNLIIKKLKNTKTLKNM